MRKNALIILTAAALWFCPLSSFSQEPLILTLQKSIELALTQNPSHLAAAEREDAAEAQVREAAAAFFPSLNAQGLHTLDEKVMELEFPSFIPGEPPQKVEVDFTRDYQFSLSLNLPLFTGGRLTAGYKQAKYNLKSTRESVRQSRQSTIYQVKQAFYGYLLTRELVRVAEEAVAVAEKHHRNVNNLYEVGMASKLDLLRSEVQVANLKPQLIKARNSLKVAEIGLKTILGLEIEQMIEVEGNLHYEPYYPDLEKCIQEAMSARPELLQISYQKQIAQQMVKTSQASRLPTIAISGNYNYWADKFNFKEDTWSSYYAVNLVMTIPLFNGFSSSARVAQSKSVMRELELTEKSLKDMVIFEINQAFLNLKEAEESLQSQEKNVEQAAESLRIAELNYAEGLVTHLDVSSAQASLSQAKTYYSQALYDYVVARAALEKAVGKGWEE
ncbi:MAG: TolC family protein [Acidobacteriota bacterium]